GRRRSNVPLLPDLNVESRADTALMNAKTEEILALLK
ncbi:phosphomannomutase, partial [Klebsiella pneumoniae]|nr:phosphomannomutase [Klebsiella pneumoniae]